MKYYLMIIGCQMNYSDAERLKNILDVNDCHQVLKEDKADLIFVVSCSVRQKAMDKIFGHLKKWRQKRKLGKIKTVLTGCVLPADKTKLKKDFDVLIDIKDILLIPKILKLDKNSKTGDSITNADYLGFRPNYSSKFQAYIPIMTGCNNFCTFCAVPYTRGAEASRPSSEIINEITDLIKKGYKEITLLGQNVNAYLDPEQKHHQNIIDARSRKYWEYHNNQPVLKRIATTKVPKDFTALIKKINRIPGDFWIRFVSSNPQDVSDELIKTLPRCKKVTKHFHFALQSGDNEVLRRMNRRHTRQDYINLVNKIKKSWPGVAITTDIIVGFPGETKKQFLNSASLMKQIKFDMAYLAEYSPRPGTAAQRFFKDDIPKKEKTRRKLYLNNILGKSVIANNKKYINKTVRVLVDSYNKYKKISSGKTETNKNVKFKSPNLIGQFTEVNITNTTAWGLEGVIKK